MLATIPPPPADVFEIGPLSIHLYGIAIAIGALLAISLARRRWTALGGNPDTMDRIGIMAVLAGLVGARLAYVFSALVFDPDARGRQFIETPWRAVAVWEGGLAFFGGLLFGAAMALWLARRARLSMRGLADAAAPGIPLAQALGRWGNYFNQELYGTPTDLPWALEVEAPFRVPPYQAEATFHPTFLYESLWNLLLVAFLLWLDRRGRLTRGALIFVYAIGYGTMRFLLELIRTDTDWRLLGISRNGYVALLVVAIGVAGLVWAQRRWTPETGTVEPGAEPQAAEDAPLLPIEGDPASGEAPGAAADTPEAEAEVSSAAPADAEAPGDEPPNP